MFRAVAVLLAGVLVGILGLAALVIIDPKLADSALTTPAFAQPTRPVGSDPAVSQPVTARPMTDEPATGPVAGQSDAADVPALDPGLANREWRASTATRHVPTPAEAALTGAVHPATDRVMALLIGWVLLALLGGGLLAPRH